MIGGSPIMLTVECGYDVIPSELTGHSHSYAHFYFPISDILYIRIDESDYWINSNSIAYVHSDLFHRIICTKKVIWFSVPKEQVEHVRVENLIRNPIISIPEYLHHLVELIRYEASSDPAGRCVQYLFQYLFTKLISIHAHTSIRFLEMHYMEPINLQLLSTIENYNSNYYISWFRNQTGQTPSEYLTQIRITKAKELLITTNYRVNDIALQVGYTNASSFARKFRNITGCRPLEYRNKGKHMQKFSELPYWADSD